MVIIDPAIDPSKELAPSAPPVKIQPQFSVNQSVACLSNETVAKANTIAPPAMTAGRNQKLVRTLVHVLKNSTLITTLSLSIVYPAEQNGLRYLPEGEIK
jgi:hypothetical protein